MAGTKVCASPQRLIFQDKENHVSIHFLVSGAAAQSDLGRLIRYSLHSVGLCRRRIGLSDRPLPFNATPTIERLTCPRRDPNPESQEASGRRPSPFDCSVTYIGHIRVYTYIYITQRKGMGGSRMFSVAPSLPRVSWRDVSITWRLALRKGVVSPANRLRGDLDAPLRVAPARHEHFAYTRLCALPKQNPPVSADTCRICNALPLRVCKQVISLWYVR